MAKGRGKRDKKPVTAVSVDTTKRPFSGAPRLDDSRSCIAWRFSKMDMEGPWACSKIRADKLTYVREKLAHYEGRTWADAYAKKASGLKHIPTGELPNAARRRLETLELDDLEGVYEIRLSGKERIWGIRLDNVCYLLWWDPEHRVFPIQR